MLAAYVHDLDPVLFSITDTLKIRWYGLAYLAGFLLGWWLLKRFAEKQLFPLAPDKVSDFIAYAAFFGVFLGGRIGYVLFYMLPTASGRQAIVEDPLTIVKVWDGGMASHGGIIGLAIFTWVYARKMGVGWRELGDGLCTVAPLGILFGRIANFINGELYGRVAEGLPWLVKFPKALSDHGAEEFVDRGSALAVAEAVQAGAEDNLEAAIRANDAVKMAIEPFLLERHPSQLYEALVEGLLLFVILFALRVRYPRLPHGILTGLFFLIYALGRILVENFREPDAALIGILTKGQFYSVFFVAIGIAFLLFAGDRKEGSKPQ